MPQGAVRRKPNGQLNGRRPGQRVPRTGTRNSTIPKRKQTRPGRFGRIRDWSTAFQTWRWSGVTPRGNRRPRKPKIPAGQLSARRAGWNIGHGFRMLAKHRRGAALCAFGLGFGELGLYAGFRTTGALLGLVAALAGMGAAGVLSRTHSSTSSRSTARRRRP